MLKAILYFSLRYRAVVVFIAFAFLAFGLSQLRTAQYDVFPEFASSLVNIQTEAPGLSPEQVELLVTQPIENAVNGLPAIDSMRSSSIQGLSVITLIFKEGGSIYQDRQVVSERIAGLSSILPLGARAPIMSPLTSSSGDLMSIGITSSKLTLQELRTLVDWSIKPRLLAVPGVAKVGIFGGLVKQLQIQLHPKKLIELGLSIEDVIAVAQKVIGIRGAGFIDTTKQRITIQTDGQLATIRGGTDKT